MLVQVLSDRTLEPPAPDAVRAPRGLGVPVLLRRMSGPVPAVAAGWVAAVGLAVLLRPEMGLFVALGLAGGFVAGLVGVGGAIVMFPLLLYVPPAIGLAALSVHTVAGVTMVQVAAASLAGMLGHLHHGAVRGSLVGTLGGAMMVGSLTGALWSRSVDGSALTALFASLALVAAATMFLPAGWRSPDVPADAPLRFNRTLAFAGGLVVGVLVGMVGAGGGFLLVPLMLYLLRIPMRPAVGASLAIILLAGVAGATGKIVTGQVHWPLALALVSGALPGAWGGAAVSRHTATRALAHTLGVILALVAATMWWEVLRS